MKGKQMMGQEPQAVYKAIATVTRALGHAGIGKGRKNVQQGYNFRGIDDIYNALSSELSSAELCIIPRIIDREVVERQTKNGGALFYVTIKAEYDIVSALDGSCHTASAYGEAMDSGDKATNKAMSAAYKYMAMQLFCIPTEGDNDADSTTHEVAPRGATFAPSKAKAPEPQPPAEPSPPADDVTQLANAVKKLRDTASTIGITIPPFSRAQARDRQQLESERAASRARLYAWLSEKGLNDGSEAEVPDLADLDDKALVNLSYTAAGL